MSTVRVNGVDLHVEQLAPIGPARGTAVLIHGLGSDSMASWFLTLAHPLAAAGMRVLLYDLRGHGHSERPPTGYRLDDFVADLAALLREWQVDEPAYLVGNSFGGTIAYAYATRHPEQVTGLVAIESAPPTAAWFAAMARRLALIGAGGVPGAGPWRARRIEAATALLARTSIGTDLPASRLPDPGAITALNCPVLCLFGTDSALHPLTGETTRLLPHAERVDFPGQRHTLLIDHPAPVRESVLRWLQHIPAR